MTQEEKDLLLKDLCTRLPYGVKVHAKYIDTCTNIEDEKDGVLSMVDNDTVIAFAIDGANCYNYVAIHEVKPYLFPLSTSMSEEQEKECQQIKHSYYFDDDSFVLFDWYNKNHFDYRGLIPLGLAIDATNLDIY